MARHGSSRAATQSQRRWRGKAPQSRDTPRYKLAMARQSPSPWKGRLTPQSAPQGWPPKRRREGWQRGASASETIVRRQRRLGVSPGSIPLPKFRTSTKNKRRARSPAFSHLSRRLKAESLVASLWLIVVAPLLVVLAVFLHDLTAAVAAAAAVPAVFASAGPPHCSHRAGSRW